MLSPQKGQIGIEADIPSLRQTLESHITLDLFHVKQKTEHTERQTRARGEALAFMSTSRAMAERLDIYVDLLGRWRKITNLVSESTFSDVWMRHFADCQQIIAFAPDAKRWLDLGSGAGFPGMVIAIQLAETPGALVHCVESDQRKCAFLRAVATATGAPARLHSRRIEALDVAEIPDVQAVTARAVAPLPQLIEYAEPWLRRGAVGIFPRGRSAQTQVGTLDIIPQFQIETFPSKIDPDARIVQVRLPSQSP